MDCADYLSLVEIQNRRPPSLFDHQKAHMRHVIGLIKATPPLLSVAVDVGMIDLLRKLSRALRRAEQSQ